MMRTQSLKGPGTSRQLFGKYCFSLRKAFSSEIHLEQAFFIIHKVKKEPVGFHPEQKYL
jgi:hypothetical protein